MDKEENEKATDPIAIAGAAAEWVYLSLYFCRIYFLNVIKYALY